MLLCIMLDSYYRMLTLTLEGDFLFVYPKEIICNISLGKLARYMPILSY